MISPRKILALIHAKKQLLLLSVLEGLFLTIWEQTEQFSSLQRRRKTAIFCQKDPLAHKSCLFTYPLKFALIYSVQKGIYSAFQISYPVLCHKAFGITHPNSPLLNMLFKDLFQAILLTFLFKPKKGGKKKPKACGRLLWNVLPQALLCWLSSWLIRIPGMHYTGFFWKRWLIGKAMLLLDHKTGFMVFLKTIKLAQLTHMNSYRVLRCPISLTQAKLHCCIRILKGLKQPFSWRAYLNN